MGCVAGVLRLFNGRPSQEELLSASLFCVGNIRPIYSTMGSNSWRLSSAEVRGYCHVVFDSRPQRRCQHHERLTLDDSTHNNVCCLMWCMRLRFAPGSETRKKKGKCQNSARRVCFEVFLFEFISCFSSFFFEFSIFLDFEFFLFFEF